MPPHLTCEIRFHKGLTLTPCHPLYFEQERDMNIGELARQTGVSLRSLRYYETKQLLSSHRGENGYRTYDHTAIERVRMIQFYLHLGLSTQEIFDVVLCSNPDDVASFCDGTAL